MKSSIQKGFILIKFARKGFTKGFTLIELLVVVLIIGILAAIAVPQYQRAVYKTRFSEVITNVYTLKNQVDMYQLTDGKPPSNIWDLELATRPGMVESFAVSSLYSCVATTKNGFTQTYCLSKDGRPIFSGYLNIKKTITNSAYIQIHGTQAMCCAHQYADAWATDLCKNLAGSNAKVGGPPCWYISL